jgi:polyhydroxyalkanoate synthase
MTERAPDVPPGGAPPEEILAEFWKQSSASWEAWLGGWQKALADGQAAWLESLRRPAMGLPPQAAAGWDAWRAMGAFGLPTFNPWAPGSAGGAGGDPDAWARQLEQAVLANLQASLQAMHRTSERMRERVRASDPQAMERLWNGLLQEYARDLEALPARFAPGRSEDLSRFVRELSAGDPSPEARRYLSRFLESLRVKATLGAEHYVDPGAGDGDSARLAAVNPTSRELVLESGSLKLWRYGDAPHVPGRPPILLVYSIINRAWILDLIPGFSLVRHLLDRGLDVYVVEWEPARPGVTDTLDDYVDPMLRAAVARVRGLAGLAEGAPVNLFGWCIGGTLALLYAAAHPEDVRSLVTLTTPVTSTGSGVLELFADERLFPMDEILERHGMMPGKVVRAGIMAIKPYLEVLKWKHFYENLHDDRVMALFYPLDRWANDNPDLAGPVFRRFIQDVYRDDALVRGRTLIHGRPLDLAAVRCPLLNIVAEDDWIVPVKAADRVVDLVGSARRENLHIPGPHVGIVMDPRTRPAWDRIADHALEESP